jgi:hypothetical protein
VIELRDSIDIDVPPEVVWDWLEHLPDHYLEWHPDHLGARWVREQSFAPGAVMEAREVLHGKAHTLRMVMTEARPGRFVRYRFFPGAWGELRVDPVDGGSRFTAGVDVGTRAPVVGPVLDRVLRATIGSRLESVARHQAEEGVNLKALLERPDLR